MKRPPRSRPPHAKPRPPFSARGERPRQAPAPRVERARGTFLPGGIEIVHEDDDVVVVNKPGGMLTSRGPDVGPRAESVFDTLKRYVRDARRRRGTQVWIVHRLDKEASGLLVFAKTQRAFERLKEEFRTKAAHRLYAAVVEGEVRASTPGNSAASDDSEQPAGARTPRRLPEQTPCGTVKSFLLDGADGVMRSVPSPTGAPSEGEEGGAQLAITHWRVQEVGSGRTLLQVRLETGRKNQIRVHLKEMGRPIVGDRRYGAASDPLGRLCLHAYELGFTHPATGASVRYRAPTPGSFFGLVGKRDDVSGGAPVEARTPPDSPGSREPVTRAKPAPTSASRERTPVEHAPPRDGSWDHVAEWYDDLIGIRGSDHHEQLIIPGTLRLLGVRPGERVLDVACGQGVLARALASRGASVVGVDASERLIDAAKREAGERESYVVGDARELGALALGAFDAAACVMALMNIEPLGAIAHGIAQALTPGGRFVAVILHPAFRSPGLTSWEWGSGRGASGSPRAPSRESHGAPRLDPSAQYRRVDAYLSPASRDIVMNPGEAARGIPPVMTTTHHRPIGVYVNALAGAGLLVDAVEEWASRRRSEPGPRAEEENRARREIPMFIAFRAVKIAR